MAERDTSTRASRRTGLTTGPSGRPAVCSTSMLSIWSTRQPRASHLHYWRLHRPRPKPFPTPLPLRCKVASLGSTLQRRSPSSPRSSTPTTRASLVGSSALRLPAAAPAPSKGSTQTVRRCRAASSRRECSHRHRPGHRPRRRLHRRHPPLHRHHHHRPRHLRQLRPLKREPPAGLNGQRLALPCASCLRDESHWCMRLLRHAICTMPELFDAGHPKFETGA